MFADVLGEVLEAELDTTLGYDKQERRPDEEGKPKNYRNGHTTKTVKTQLGEVEITVPRDRNGEYEPQIIGKYSRNADGTEEKILSLYAAGMSQRDIYLALACISGQVCCIILYQCIQVLLLRVSIIDLIGLRAILCLINYFSNEHFRVSLYSK